MGYAQEKVMPYGDKTPKGKQVEHMFNHIAHSYDRLNHFLSLGIDKGWRRKSIQAVSAFPHQDVLDVATGTGDFAILAAQMLKPQKIMAVDLSEGMMDIGKEKVKNVGLEDVIEFKKEDCMQLSFVDNSFDVVTVAYGVRNYQNLDRGLKEMHRVLRPDGHAVILELGVPQRFPMKQLFSLYSRVVMPFVGLYISHDRKAYTYLPATMEVVPQGEEMKQILLKAGFSEVRFRKFTFGLSTLYICSK